MTYCFYFLFREALNVSEAILSNTKTTDDWVAMYVKAESLFNMCDFEHSMIFYARAQKHAPAQVPHFSIHNNSTGSYKDGIVL